MFDLGSLIVAGRLAYFFPFTQPQRKKFIGVKSHDLVGILMTAFRGQHDQEIMVSLQYDTLHSLAETTLFESKS